MEKKKEKTSTKTLELRNIQKKLKEADEQAKKEADEANLENVQAPTVDTNKSDEDKVRKGTQVLLHAKKAAQEKDDNDIEFSASTAVFQLTDEMKDSLASGQSSEDATVALKIAPEKADEETVDEIKKKVKAHYIKRARILEAEINKILSGFKTENPSVIKRIKMIQTLLGKHSGRIKKKKKK